MKGDNSKMVEMPVWEALILLGCGVMMGLAAAVGLKIESRLREWIND